MQHPAIRNLRRQAIACLAVCALSTLSACNAFPPLNLKSPTLSFADFQVTQLGLSEIRFLLTVQADNPNEVDIPLSNLKFDLELLDRPFASGAGRDATLVLPARGTRAVPIDFTVPTVRLIDLVKGFRLTDVGSLAYRLKGSANWGSSGFSIPFDRRGDLEGLRKLLELIGEAMPAGKVALVPVQQARPG